MPGYSLIPSTQMTVGSSVFQYNHFTQLYSGTLTLKNISGASIAGPFRVVLGNLTSGVAAYNPAGTIGGLPYFSVANASLAAGQSVSVTVQFTDPGNAVIGFQTLVYH
jgi:hypothetical protein